MTPRSRDGIRLDPGSLEQSYKSGAIDPAEVVRFVYRKIADDGDNPIWTSVRPIEETLAEARRLEDCHKRGEDVGLPLFGVPFAVKDNIDLAGMATTAGGLAFDRIAASDAAVVARLRKAGAIAIGKTNLDQFATGLTGTRSNFGVCRNAVDHDYISGGSSSGSAVAVAAGHVGFALGTDTAGSGRVPAALNGVVGMKPTRGLLSASGVAPACRTLDCVSIFARDCADALRIFKVAETYDDGDAFSRRGRRQRFPRGGVRVGVLARAQAEFFGDEEAERLYAAVIARFESEGARLCEIDFTPFREAGSLLYEGPWLAERLAAFRNFVGADTATRRQIHPVIRAVLEKGTRFSAADVFEGYYRLRELARQTMDEWSGIDAIVLPTAAPIYTVDEVLAEPIETNRRLGLYTNFVNLLDLCAVAIPAGRRRGGLPFGVTLVAPPLHDEWLCALGARWEAL